ncbi:MAG: dTDP-4-dehydrorhamnose 3,5-epimerase family protein [Roseibacillus sp.]
MNRQTDSIQDVTISSRPKLQDERGWFLPALTGDDFKANWVLQNISHSNPGTLRGLHYQSPHAQSKFLILLEGSVQDIVADLRPDSPTYLHYAVYHLDASAQNQLFVPKGCAHGFLVTGHEPALISYLTDAPYHPESEKTLLWNDPDWNFPWLHSAPILSPKDQSTEIR